MIYPLLLSLVTYASAQFTTGFGTTCSDAASGCETQKNICGMPDFARRYCMKTCNLCSGGFPAPAPAPVPNPGLFPNPQFPTTTGFPFQQGTFGGNDNFNNNLNVQLPFATAAVPPNLRTTATNQLLEMGKGQMETF